MTCAANWGPQSAIIALGKPIHFQTLSTSSWLVCSAVIVLWQGTVSLLCYGDQ